MLKLYRIINSQLETVANHLDNDRLAQEVLDYYRTNYPNDVFELESYTQSTVRGMGRDPDLH
jgi:hypothetical protein